MRYSTRRDLTVLSPITHIILSSTLSIFRLALTLSREFPPQLARLTLNPELSVWLGVHGTSRQRVLYYSTWHRMFHVPASSLSVYTRVRVSPYIFRRILQETGILTFKSSSFVVEILRYFSRLDYATVLPLPYSILTGSSQFLSFASASGVHSRNFAKGPNYWLILNDVPSRLVFTDVFTVWISRSWKFHVSWRVARGRMRQEHGQKFVLAISIYSSYAS